jgi:hypothetical protein
LLEFDVESYRLVFADDGIGVARRVEFEAEDLPHALVFAHREAKNRSAVLWQGERRLCTIARPAAEPAFLPPQAWAEQAAA